MQQKITPHVLFNYTYNRHKKRWSLLLRPILVLPIIILLSCMGVSNSSNLWQLTDMTTITNSISEIYNPITPDATSMRDDTTTVAATNTKTSSESDTTEVTTIINIEHASTLTTPLTPLQNIISYSTLCGTLYLLLWYFIVFDASITMLIPLFLAVPIDFMIVFRKNYPEWMYTTAQYYIKAILSFKLYVFGISDQYPSLTPKNPELTIDLPGWTEPVSRWIPIVRRIILLPNIIMLLFINALWFTFYIFIWIWMIISGTMPLWFHDWTIGLMRWALRIICYSNVYTSNTYPPFSTK